MDVRANKEKQSGRPIYLDVEPAGEKLYKSFGYILEGFEPGTITSARRIIKAYQNKINDFGGTSTPENEIIGVVAGQKIQTIDIGKSFQFKSYKTGENLYQAISIYTKTLYDKKINDESKKEALKKANKIFSEYIHSAHLDYKYASQLGVNQDKLDEIIDRMYIGRYKASNKIKKAIKIGEELIINEEGKIEYKNE